jgi:hypothetical protein
VFATGKDITINVNNLRYRTWKRLLDHAGLPSGTRMHDLRHSTATLPLSRSVPVKVVSEMLGHADVGITLSIYAHVLPGMQGRCCQRSGRGSRIALRRTRSRSERFGGCWKYPVTRLSCTRLIPSTFYRIQSGKCASRKERELCTLTPNA